jgi:hypothetical protein
MRALRQLKASPSSLSLPTSSKQKDRPKAVSLTALIEAENQATRTPPPPILSTQPLASIYAILAQCGVKEFVSWKKLNERCPHDTKRGSLENLVFEPDALGIVLFEPRFRGVGIRKHL